MRERERRSREAALNAMVDCVDTGSEVGDVSSQKIEGEFIVLGICIAQLTSCVSGSAPG